MKNAIVASILVLVLAPLAGAATASAATSNEAVPTTSNATAATTPRDYAVAGVKSPMWGTYKHSAGYIAQRNLYRGGR